MKNKETALNEIVRVARLASGGDADFLRAVATAIWKEAEGSTAEADTPEDTAVTPSATDEVVTPDRSALAAYLADRMDAPRQLVLELASMPITTAQAILERSTVLTQEDLSALALRMSREHLATIAGRWDVGPNLADVLVNQGDGEILRAVLANPNTKLADKTLVNLGKRAMQSVELQLALLIRGNLPADVISLLLDKVQGGQKDLLLSKLIQVDPNEAVQKYQVPAKTRQSRQFVDARQTADRLASRRGVDEPILVTLASQKKQIELLMCCAKLFKLDLDVTLGIVSNETGLSLATFCRAYDLSVDAFSQIIMTPGISAPKGSAGVLNLLQFYKRLQVPDAITAVRMWRQAHVEDQTLEADQAPEPEEMPLSA